MKRFPTPRAWGKGKPDVSFLDFEAFQKLWNSPKTKLLIKAAKAAGRKCKDIKLSHSKPSDFRGLPYRKKGR
jgi:hypothetical protein